jgi:hypothetical protein
MFRIRLHPLFYTQGWHVQTENHAVNAAYTNAPVAVHAVLAASWQEAAR